MGPSLEYMAFFDPDVAKLLVKCAWHLAGKRPERIYLLGGLDVVRILINEAFGTKPQTDEMPQDGLAHVSKRK